MPVIRFPHRFQGSVRDQTMFDSIRVPRENLLRRHYISCSRDARILEMPSTWNNHQAKSWARSGVNLEKDHVGYNHQSHRGGFSKQYSGAPIMTSRTLDDRHEAAGFSVCHVGFCSYLGLILWYFLIPPF